MQPERNIHIRANLEDLSRFAAEFFVSIASQQIANNGKFSVALSGGSTPRALYSLLAADPFRDRVDWYSTVFLFGDERNVLPTSERSNYRMASETLFDPLRSEAVYIKRWKTELGPEAAAAEYDSTLRKEGPIDLVLLGLGADAHTASLFPNSAALRECEKLAVANWVEKLDEYRLTMTFPAINQAKHVMFLVAGDDKADALAEVLHGEFRPTEFPAQTVRPLEGEIYWMVDEAAASNLKR